VLRLLLMLAALAGPHPPSSSVHVNVPRPYELWDGRVQGRVAAGATALSVQSGGHLWQVAVEPDGSFDQVVSPAPAGDASVTVGGRLVTPVYGVPSGSIAALPPPDDDGELDVVLRRLAAAASPHVGIYTRSWSGVAAAYNAGAQFEAASTLKLPIMVEALSQNAGELSQSQYWEPMERVTRYSDNAAANQLLVATGGSEEGGAARMVALMHSLGFPHTYMAGGYLTGGGGPPLMAVVDPPPTAYKHTTPGEMATLATLIVDAAAGRGALLGHGVSQHEARELLYLMVHAEDPGLVPAGAHGLPVAHKIGWLDDTDNDVAIVFTYRGPVVIAIYTVGSQDGTAQAFGVAATGAILTALKGAAG
jgi:beta-lactamase class A